jgi:hypothetical protein
MHKHNHICSVRSCSCATVQGVTHRVTSEYLMVSHDISAVTCSCKLLTLISELNA